MTPSYSSGRNGGYYFYYLCTSLNNGAEECKMKRVCAEALENAVARRFIEMGKDDKILKEILEEADCSSKKEREILEECLNLQRRALAPIEQEIKNIVKFIAKGKSTPALAGELEKLELQKKQINEEIEKIEMEIQEVNNKALNAEFIKEGLTFFELAWQIADPK
jgi:valyl-tRNA synthetase